MAFLRRALRPAVSVLDDRNITSFLAVDDVVLVAHPAPGDAGLAARFAALAAEYRDRFAFAVGPPRRPSSVACYNTLDDEQRATAELDAAGSLETFALLCAAPLIVELTRRNEVEVMGVRIPGPPCVPLLTRRK